MITSGLLALVLCVGVAVAFMLAGRAGSARRAFIRLSWIPTAALVLEYLFFNGLASALSYFAIVIPILTCVASLVLALVGAALLASERHDGGRRPDLVWATVVASVPGVLLAGYLVFELVAVAVRKGI